MKRLIHASLCCSIACLSLVLIGCSKEAADDSTAPASALPVDAAASAKAADLLKQAETALKDKEFDKAAQLIIDVQREGAKLSEAQTAAASKLMQDLQSALGDEIAKGNPKAKAAVDILRRSTSGR